MSHIENNVARHRSRAGLSVTALAERVGISRQALGAIEAGRSVPSTAVSLRLASALGCRVEDLFALPLETLAAQPNFSAGQRVSLARVDGSWVAHALARGSVVPADGIAAGGGRVEMLADATVLEDRALVLGCAPVLGPLAAGLLHGSARWLNRSSSDALGELAAGRAHIVGLHLADADAPGRHDELVRAALPGAAVDVVSFITWREGIVVAAGNPLGIGSVADLVRPGVRVALRAAGSGAAAVLADALGQHDLSVDDLHGIHVASHVEAAMIVRHGAADAAVVIEPVAEALGLGFQPLSSERFELLVRRSHRDHPGVQRVFDRLVSRSFANEVRAMGAYDLTQVGDVRTVSLT